MGSNHAYLHRPFQSQCPLRLVPGLVEKFTAAVDDPNSCYRGEQALVPPMMVVIATIAQGVIPLVRNIDFIGGTARLSKLVHLAEEICWHAPLQMGDALVAQTRVLTLDEQAAGELIDIGTRVLNQRDICVAESRTHLFVREKRTTGLARSGVAASPAEAALRVQWQVAADQAARYAAVSGDDNQIHLDPLAARAAGFRGVVLHGLCTMSFVFRAVANVCCPEEPHRLRRLQVRFNKPVYMGDQLTCTAWDMAQSPSWLAPPQAGPRVASGRVLALRVTNQQERAVINDGLAEIIP